MKKAVIFGVGKRFEDYLQNIEKTYEVVGCIDNNWMNKDADVRPVEDIRTMEYDVVLVTPDFFSEMYDQLIDEGVEKNKIIVLAFGKPAERILSYDYYGQHCEDLIIAAIFKRMGIEKPSYMDLGANHPFLGSNTAILYMNGCRGINIEANPDLIHGFEIVRPEDINLQTGIAKNDGNLVFYKYDKASGLNTFLKEKTRKWNKEVQECIELPVITLKKVVDQYCPNGFPDFLDCDIEGLDYEVLEDYDLAGNGPKVCCVEVIAEDIGKFDVMMDGKGYYRFCRLGENNIYIRKEYSKIVSHFED